MIETLIENPTAWLAGLPVVDLLIVGVVLAVALLLGGLAGGWAEARFAGAGWLPPGSAGRIARTVRAAVVSLALVVLLSAPGFG
ncbi:hypothetical protein, partial [Polymorphobacter multimanifer]